MWAKDYKMGGCTSCIEGAQYVMMVLVVLLFVGILAFGVRSSIQGAEDDDSTSAMLFKILISFTMTNKEVLQFRQEWPPYLTDMFTPQ